MSSHDAHGCGGCRGYTNPVDVLKNEHRVIEIALGAMDAAVPRDPIDVPFFRDVVDFLRNYTDGCHHAKEEHELFPRMEAAGVPRETGPIGCMLAEHVQGRTYVGRMNTLLDEIERGTAGAPADFRATAKAYVELLRNHIWKEDNILFEIAGRAIPQADRGALSADFERAAECQGGAARHEHYVRLARSLHERALAGGAGASS